MHNLDFQATTYPNGKFESQAMYNENKTDGFRVRWYESGQMKFATEYKHDYSKDAFLTTNKLWNIWLNSEYKELIKTLRSIEKHKFVFCKTTNYN